MAKERKKHTTEFKRDAVRMMRNRGSRTVAQVADDLGVNSNQLHRWAKQLEQEGTAVRNEQGETLEQGDPSAKAG
jgi:transposase-like protein